MLRRTFMQLLGFVSLPKSVPTELSSLPTLTKNPDSLEWERIKNQAHQKAFNCLLAAGFKPVELEKIRKDIAKCMPEVKQHRQRYIENYWKSEGLFTPFFPCNPWLASAQSSQFWDAIVVTFKTNQDGFLMLNIESSDHILKEQNA